MSNSLSLEEQGKRLVERLGGRWTDRGGLCRCPSHTDRTPSLSVRPGRTRLLFHCFAGCSSRDILVALAASGDLAPGGPSSAAAVGDARPASSMRDTARRLWHGARPIAGTMADRYLAARGLEYSDTALRFHPRTPFGRHPQTIFAPALIAAVSDDVGPVAIHRTRLDSVTHDACAESGPRRAALGALGSGTVRLMPPAPCLGLAEGIESALAATMLSGVPCWATLGAARFGRISLPSEVSDLVLFLDRDEAGRQAERLARKTFEGRLAVHARYPAGPYSDWNDVLLAGAPSPPIRERGGGG